MNSKFSDVIVAKEYETHQNGEPQKKTKWNRVGQAWTTNSGKLAFELYMFPGQRFLVAPQDSKTNTETEQGAQ
jgi:hypothetical protein